MPRGFLGLALGCALLLSAVGCGGSSSSRVKGKVLFNGAPLAGAEVLLEVRDKGGSGGYGAKTDAEGNFEIKSLGDRTIKPGTYQVLISKFVDAKGKTLDPEEYEQARARGELRNMLPAAYSDPSASKLSAEVKEGETVLPPFDLKGPKGK